MEEKTEAQVTTEETNEVETVEFTKPEEEKAPVPEPISSDGPPVDRAVMVRQVESQEKQIREAQAELARLNKNAATVRDIIVAKQGAVAQMKALLK
jgi:hypothetical protein